MFDSILTPEFIAGLMSLVGIVLTAIIGAAAKAFHAYTGIQIEAKHRQALHEAMISGVEAAIAHGPSQGLRTTTQLAVAYVHRSVPDAIRALVPGETVLDTIAERYAIERLNRWHLPPPGTESYENFVKSRG